MSDARATGASEPRVIVVSDDPLARTGIALLLGAQAPGVVIAQLGSRDDLPTALQLDRPDALLWDLGADPKLVADRLPEVDALGAPTVVLLPDDTYASDAVALGVRGVLLRDADGGSLLAALRAVARGLLVLDPSLAASVLPAGRERMPTRGTEDLTARELEVLQLLAGGLANKTIAQRLGISDHTVKFHVNAILAKLAVQSRTEAVVRAVRLGLVIL